MGSCGFDPQHGQTNLVRFSRSGTAVWTDTLEVTGSLVLSATPRRGQHWLASNPSPQQIPVGSRVRWDGPSEWQRTFISCRKELVVVARVISFSSSYFLLSIFISFPAQVPLHPSTEIPTLLAGSTTTQLYNEGHASRRKYNYLEGGLENPST